MFSSNPQIEHFSTVLLLLLMNKLYEEYIRRRWNISKYRHSRLTFIVSEGRKTVVEASADTGPGNKPIVTPLTPDISTTTVTCFLISTTTVT